MPSGCMLHGEIALNVSLTLNLLGHDSIFKPNENQKCLARVCAVACS